MFENDALQQWAARVERRERRLQIIKNILRSLGAAAIAVGTQCAINEGLMSPCDLNKHIDDPCNEEDMS